MVKSCMMCMGIVSILAGAGFAQPPLQITEIDYDQPGSDTAEWVEIHNTQDYEYILDGVSLVLYDGDLNGTCTEYCRVDLSPLGWILDGGYVVIGAHPCAVMPLCTDADAMQNGAPDVITIEEFGIVIHSVEYESDLMQSACHRPVSSRTSVGDSDSEPGTLQLLCSRFWRFLSVPTPCAPRSCTVSDVPPPSMAVTPVSWAGAKALYKSVGK